MPDHHRASFSLDEAPFRVDYFSDRLNLVNVPVAWLNDPQAHHKDHLLDYPFLFDADTLVSYFRSINFARMSRTFEASSSLENRINAIVDPGILITNPHQRVVLQELLGTASSKYLILEVGRETVLRDAFDQLWRREQRELLRPLKVHLGEDTGEEGFDSGGVQQEFFRIAIAECLNPDYGAFVIDERTHMAWFAPGSVVEDWRFQLIGLVFSLAVYNGLTLPVTFPKALYRKLLGQPVEDLHHIADGWPDLVSGLTALLQWDEQQGRIEDVFARTYEFSTSTYGHINTQTMKQLPDSWPKAILDLHGLTEIQTGPTQEPPVVTNDNRIRYVKDYVRYLTEVSVKDQYAAFEKGFRTCLNQKSLGLLSPAILQTLVEGLQVIDMAELRRCARYIGWDVSHHTVQDFWSIVEAYDDPMRRKLLEFVTASDRVPVGGVKSIQFVLQKNGIEEGGNGHLPTAYTCYGTLLLPEYRDRETLDERLRLALENAQGFGFA